MTTIRTFWRLRCRIPNGLSWGDPFEYRPFFHDFTVMAGGGLLYEKAGANNSSLRYHFRYPATAQWFDRKTAMLATGMQGPLTADVIEPYLPVLERMELRTVRDRHSAEFLRGAGVASVLECSDLVYASPSSLRIYDWEPKNKPVLGVVASQPGAGLAHDKYEGFESRICSALELLEKDFQLHFFSFDNRSDPWLASSWNRPSSYSEYDADNEGALGRFTEAMGHVDLFLTTRFHGAVLSILNRTPFVALGAPGQKTFRECESIDYPHLVSYAASAEELTETVRRAWSQRHETRELLERASPSRQRLGHRNFELLRTAQVEPDILAPKIVPGISDQTKRDRSRSLVVWAANEMFWPEASCLFDGLGAFDCLLPPKSGLSHPRAQSLLHLGAPGIMNWDAFGDSLQKKLSQQYDDVFVCHSAEGSAEPESLFGVGARSGRRVWDFRLWPHTICEIGQEDLVGYRSQGNQAALKEPVLQAN